MPTILVVEDEVILLILAEDVLQEAGHTTLTAANMAQALALIESAPTPIPDLLFTDITLGDAQHGGLEVAQRAVRVFQGIKVLYTTGLPVTDGMRELLVEGSSMLRKPYTVPQLTEAVAALLKGKK